MFIYLFLRKHLLSEQLMVDGRQNSSTFGCGQCHHKSIVGQTYTRLSNSSYLQPLETRNESRLNIVINFSVRISPVATFIYVGRFSVGADRC